MDLPVRLLLISLMQCTAGSAYHRLIRQADAPPQKAGSPKCTITIGDKFKVGTFFCDSYSVTNQECLRCCKSEKDGCNAICRSHPQEAQSFGVTQIGNVVIYNNGRGGNSFYRNVYPASNSFGRTTFNGYSSSFSPIVVNNNGFSQNFNRNNNNAFGRSNVCRGLGNTIIKGKDNIIQSGSNNLISDSVDTRIAAGSHNKVIKAKDSSIRAGSQNRISRGKGDTISSGSNNKMIGGEGNSIRAGSSNLMEQGRNNEIKSGSHNTVSGGRGNSISSGSSNKIAGGQGNTIKAGSNNVMREGRNNGISAGSSNRIIRGNGNGIMAGSGNHIEDSSGATIMAGSGKMVSGRSRTKRSSRRRGSRRDQKRRRKANRRYRNQQDLQSRERLKCSVAGGDIFLLKQNDQKLRCDAYQNEGLNCVRCCSTSCKNEVEKCNRICI